MTDLGEDVVPIVPPDPAAAPAPSTAPEVLPIDAPRKPEAGRPEVPGATVAARDRRKPPPRTRKEASDAKRQRGDVIALTVNIDAKRIALSTKDGPPYRGDIVTDLGPSAYRLTVDRVNSLWVFKPGQVKTGLRFTVWLDGWEPFSLTYVDPLLLLVTPGIGNPKAGTIASITKSISNMIADTNADQHLEAISLLCALSEIDLYDVLDELWITAPGVVNALALGMAPAFKGTDIDGAGNVVRAIENFTRPPKEVYVDAFDRWFVHPKSFSKNEEREHAGLSNIRLLLEFDLFPRRSLIVFADDISDNAEASGDLPQYGPASLTYPKYLSKGTTPRLYDAKNAAIAQINAQNAQFFVEAFKAVSTVLLSVYQATSSFNRIYETSMARGYAPRAQVGPGKWEPTAQAGNNMSEAAENYELTSCGTPKGMGYHVDNVQFEGFKNGKLLDAKFWQANGKVGGALVQGEEWAGWKVVNQGQRQLTVANAHGVGVEWRVADPKVADVLRSIFRAHGFAIDVVTIAP